MTITVVLTKNNQLYFNNRGHHRLSIAKILKLKDDCPNIHPSLQRIY